MLKHDKPGRVINIASMSGMIANRGIGGRSRAVRVGGERISHDDYLVADSDGVVVMASWNANGGKHG